MPRRSKVEASGLGPAVLRKNLVERKSIASIQDEINAEHGVFFSVDQLTHYIKHAPTQLVEEAQEAGLQEHLEPIFQYKDKVVSLFGDVEALKDRLSESVDETEILPVDGVFMQELAEKHGLDYTTVRKIVAATKKRLVGPVVLKHFLAVVGELRKMLELASKLDAQKRGKLSTSGSQNQPIHVHGNAMFTGMDLMSVVKQAQDAHARQGQVEDPSS